MVTKFTSNLNRKTLLNNGWRDWQNLNILEVSALLSNALSQAAVNITVLLTCSSFSVCFCSVIFLFNVSTLAVRVVTDALSVTLSFTAFSLSFSRTALTIERFKTRLNYWTKKYIQWGNIHYAHNHSTSGSVCLWQMPISGGYLNVDYSLFY